MNIIDKSSVEVYASGLDHPEGLVFDANGDLYAGGELGQVYRIAPDGQVTEICRIGGFNQGMAFGPDGFLYVCNEELGVYKVSRDGTYSLFADQVDGVRIMAPNVPFFDRSGRLYVSDSGHWGENNGKIYRFTLNGKGEVFSEGPYRFANGIAFNPEQTILYIAESCSDTLLALPIGPDGKAGTAILFLDQIDHVPDGVTVDKRGNLYVTCYASNRIYHIDAMTKEKRILLEDRDAILVASPTNCVLAGEDECELYYAQLNARFIGKVKLN